MKTKLLSTVVLSLATILPAVAQDPAFERLYEVRFLEWQQVELLVTNQCPPDPDTSCRMSQRGREIIAVLAPAAVHSRIAEVLAEKDLPPVTQTLQLVLLEGHREGTGRPPALSAAAYQALDDLAGLLPFTRYELIDSAYLRSTGRAEVAMSAAEGANYIAHLAFDDGAEGELFVSRFVLKHERWLPRGRETTPPARDWETLIETSFSVSLGETVVVGTSKLNGGDEALLVLLTAAVP